MNQQPHGNCHDDEEEQVRDVAGAQRRDEPEDRELDVAGAPETGLLRADALVAVRKALAPGAS